MKIIDFHNHVGKRTDPWIFQTAGNLHENMSHCRISQAVIFPFFDNSANHSYTEQNRMVHRISTRHPNWIPFLRLAPNSLKDALNQAGMAHQAGFKGVKLHPPSDKISVIQAEKLFCVIQQYPLPVIIHFWDNLERVWYEVFKKYPTITFIIAHGGGFNHLPLAVKIATCLPNVYLETSLIVNIGMRYIMQHLSPQKVIFGSDSPFSHPCLEMQKIKMAATRSQQRLIFFENAARILDL